MGIGLYIWVLVIYPTKYFFYNSVVREPGYFDKIYLDYIHLDFIYINNIQVDLI